MKRLLKSSGFWTAIIASIVLTVSFKITDSELVITLIGVLWGIDRTGKAGEDFVRANKGITFNKETNKHEKI